MNQSDLQIIASMMGQLDQKINHLINITSGNIQIQIAAIIEETENGQNRPLVPARIEQTPNGLVIVVKSRKEES